jgi:hypothetical protein
VRIFLPRTRRNPAQKSADFALAADFGHGTLTIHNGEDVLLERLEPALVHVPEALEDEARVRISTLKRALGVDAAETLKDQRQRIEGNRDLLLLRECSRLKNEIARRPLEQAEDDFTDLRLDALPQILRRHRAHLDQNLALPPPVGDLLQGQLILLDADLAEPEKGLAEPVVRRVARREDHAAVVEVDGFACALELHRKDAGGRAATKLNEQLREWQR